MKMSKVESAEEFMATHNQPRTQKIGFQEAVYFGIDITLRISGAKVTPEKIMRGDEETFLRPKPPFLFLMESVLLVPVHVHPSNATPPDWHKIYTERPFVMREDW